MSRQEAVSAFLDGRISRRGLVNRLIAGGVSAGAAVSYAHLLKPETATAQVAADDHYPLVDLAINATSLANTVSKGSIGVTVTTTEELRDANFRIFLKETGGGRPIGGRFIANFAMTGGSRMVTLPLDPAPLAGRTKATLYVQLTSRDDERYPALATARKLLT